MIVDFDFYCIDCLFFGFRIDLSFFGNEIYMFILKN